MPIPQAQITLQEAIGIRDLISDWLNELADHGTLDPQTEYEFLDLFNRLETAIELENCDSFGKLEIRELRGESEELFKKIIAWANITCHTQAAKFRKSRLH